MTQLTLRCRDVCLLFEALSGQAEEQQVQAAGEVPAHGTRTWAAEQLRGLQHRPGGDGGGVERPAVRGAEATGVVGPAEHAGGQSGSLFPFPQLKLCLCGELKFYSNRCSAG